MAIIYSYPTVAPTSDDLVLGTDVNASGKPTKNFTIQSIVDIVQGGATGLGAVLAINNSAKDLAGNNQSAINFINVQGTGTFTAGIFTDGTMNINGGVGAGFSSITSTDFSGNLTGIIKAGSSIEGTVTGVTQNAGDNSTKLATTAFVQQELTGSDLDFRGDAAGTVGSVDLDSQTFAVIGTANQIVTSTTAGGQTLTIGLPDDVIIADDLTVTDVLTVNGTTASNIIAGGLQVNNSGGAHAFRVKGQTNDNLINTNFGASDADDQVAIGKNTADAGTRLDVSGLIQGSTITSTGLLTANTDLWFKNKIGIGAAGTPNYGTSGQVLTSGGSGGNATWGTLTPLYNWKIDADSAVITTIASGNTVDFAGGNNISTSWAAPVSPSTTGTLTINATGLAKITGTPVSGEVAFWSSATNLNHSGSFLWLSGTVNDYGLKVDTRIKTPIFQGATPAMVDTAATWQGTVMDGFTSITSTAFVGALTGNATTATALAAPGTIQLLSGSGATQGVASNAVTYTSGGDVQLTTTLADTTVTAKALTNLPTPTSSAIASTDTILAAMAKLQGQITSTTGLAYEGTWDARNSAEGGSSDGGNPDLTQASTKVNGHFYIVSTAGNAEPNGGAGTQLSPWAVGDWCIYVSNGSSTDEWQKLDQSNEVLGSGAANKIAKWTSTNTLATGLISDDGTDVTIGTNGNLIVQGDTTLGDDAAADTITLNGPTTFESTGRFKKGLALGTATDGTEYGATGQVLTASTSAGSPPTWTTPTTGVVTSITGNYGITVAGTAAVPTIAVTSDVNNLINQATAKATPIGADSILINDSQTASAVLKKSTISSLPFDSYTSWTLAGDSGASQTISSTNTATMAGGTGITTVASATDTLTINIDTVGTDNAIEVLTAATAATGDFMWFSDINDSNTLKKSTLANLPFVPAVSGTQYTLPMFATTTTLGDSIISQNAGATQATVTGILDVTSYVQLGSITKILSADTGSIFISSRTAASGSNDVKNTALGIDALNSLANAAGANGNENVAVGYRALEDVTTGYYNTAVGSQAGLQLTTGHSSVAIGHTALDAMTVGDHNVAIGNNALTTLNESSSNDSNSNVAIGSGAAENKATGKDNVFIGKNAAYNKATGDENIYIGASVAGGGSVESGVTTIGYGISSNGSNTITLGAGSATVFYGGQNGINIGSAAKPWGDLYVDNGFFDGNITVDGNIIHGNHGNGGTYNFTDTVNASSNENIFSITGGDGACAFTVYFTCNTGSYSVAKVYTVVHSYGTTVVYNKLVDSGPYGGHDFTPTFTGATNVLTCNIANGSGSINADISTTVILGASPQNLTVAAL
jgi:hypothetical protein